MGTPAILADVQFHPRHFARIVHTLTAEHWIVEAEGRRVRQPGQFQLSVTSGVDWFELDGRLDFDGMTAALPSLLAAVRAGDRFVRLDDGSHGMLPEDWLAKYGPLARLSHTDGDTLRFAPVASAAAGCAVNRTGSNARPNRCRLPTALRTTPVVLRRSAGTRTSWFSRHAP